MQLNARPYPQLLGDNYTVRRIDSAFLLPNVVASSKLLLWLSDKQSAKGAPMRNVLSPMDTCRQLLRTLKTRYQAASKAEKSRILEEFILISGFHRKSTIRLLNGIVTGGSQNSLSAAVRSVYGAAVQQALIVLWEASERLCGKRLRVLLPHLIPAMEKHGHISLNPELRD
ncbi:hypothetical protein H9X98_10125 [Aeromonas jandaei]|uniref:hypothetical protein n=1 Tax=Aeromonas jandaei TaxID=650 RepID=UPI001F3FF119|nr:hypothetical protein [Aeromonas jandaei]MCF7718055.1 hypothetical protein [Aeromonas jandaei]